MFIFGKYVDIICCVNDCYINYKNTNYMDYFLSVFPICFATLFSLGIGLILSVVVVTFRDMKHLYSVITTAWLYLTPVFYPISMLPDSVAVIVRNNPLTLIVEILRYNVLYHQVAPFVLVLKTLIYCAVAMILGLWMFKKQQDTFILKL